MTNITGTSRYQFTVLLNEIILIVEPLDPLNIVVSNVQNSTLSVVKNICIIVHVVQHCNVCHRYVI